MRSAVLESVSCSQAVSTPNSLVLSGSCCCFWQNAADEMHSLAPRANGALPRKRGLLAMSN